MKINGNSIRPGNIIQHKNRLWVAVKIQHTQPGKGGAYLQVELKDIRDGTKLNERFRSSETVERVRLDEKEYQFLYEEGNFITLMDLETFEQLSLAKDILGDSVAFLKDGMLLKVISHEGEIVGAELPENVIMEIVEAEPVVKGQTASSSYKPALLENGVRIMVPPHIDVGIRVIVNTADGTYIERAKD
ncbi:MAG: elongation factor P [Alphaproteobacteria bacterium]|jgi:elongation factor P|nr:elongation factor P [Alphaproteobacteria bacterium]MBP7729087.1 elongation factor P [Alphaproteobacteria bacterium]